MINIWIQAVPAYNGDYCELAVDQPDLVTIRVNPGTFRIGEEDYVIDEEYLWSMTQDNSCRQWVDGFLVKHRATGEVTVLVDEHECGASEERYNWKEGPYELLHGLYSFEIPMGDPNLDNVSCQVDHIVSVAPDAGEPEDQEEVQEN